MSLERCIKYALKNPIKARGRNSISRFCTILTNGHNSYIGFNSYKTSPLQFKFSKDYERTCTHSEMDALSQATKGPYRDLSGYTMYVARVLGDDTPALAKPCQVCQAAIIYYGVGKVVHT